jgi:hypothetical protein
MTCDGGGVPRWIEKAASLVRYREEALSFIERASASLPAVPEDAEAVCLLWEEADGLDRKVSERFTAMNDGLLDGRGQLDVTRGADISRRPEAQELLVYQCTWAFQWDEDRDISVVLAIEPRSARFSAWVTAGGEDAMPLSIPIDDTRLEDTLAIAYYRAATGAPGV